MQIDEIIKFHSNKWCLLFVTEENCAVFIGFLILVFPFSNEKIRQCG